MSGDGRQNGRRAGEAFTGSWTEDETVKSHKHVISGFSRRISTILVLLILIPIGLATKFYHGPGSTWVQLYAGDIFYPMFWFFLGLLLFPRTRPLSMSAFVFIFSTAIEFSQLFDGALLTQLRRSFLGRTLVGTSFAAQDILYYLIGCLLALLLYRALNSLQLPAAASKPKGHDDPFQAGRH
ncbi:DUF2809 domain-containing protein [candidate division KSB1 bacterium]|nr:DUF2809 domain-containing protein [candidate division KSB1 bacterium]RQW04319.1 MAG: DUF2809 domain-containing protein [candidate division KSB1 bacterium]